MSDQLRTKVTTYLSAFGTLFFPTLCLLCRQEEVLTNQSFCLTCQQQLPYTNHHQLAENEFTDRFWGRVPLVAGASIFFYYKEGLVQQLIYQLKYYDRPVLGIQLGRYYGRQLKKQPLFATVDWIVPVPLHPIRLRTRGYNQSTQFTMGLSEAMGIPYEEISLKRITPTTTQTRKARIERFENMLAAFQLLPTHPFKNKHILLVDDVLTTGATLEACAARLLEVEGCRVSMVTIAIASVR